MSTIDYANLPSQKPMDSVDKSDEKPSPSGTLKELQPKDFITLFLAQLKHQNPMQPTDSSTILQQMSAIRSISATEDMQTTLHQLQDHIDISLGNSQVLTSTQLIGKKVQLPSDQAHLVINGDKGDFGGSVLMSEPASKVTVEIKDGGGNVVKTLDLGPAASRGLVDFSWDGKDEKGNLMKDDYYHFSALATIDGKQQPMQTAGSFQVKSVASDPNTGRVILNVDGLGGKYLTDIIKIL